VDGAGEVAGGSTRPRAEREPEMSSSAVSLRCAGRRGSASNENRPASALALSFFCFACDRQTCGLRV
jgi:hypothetical protein